MIVKIKGIFCIFILIFSSYACNSYENSGLKTIVKTPDQETWNFKFDFTKDGVSQVTVNSGHMIKFNEKGIYELNQSVLVDFFNKNGKHTSKIISDSGLVEENGNFMIAMGNVKIISDSGAVLRSEELKWDKGKKKIYTDKFVTIYSKGDTVRGYGLESDEEIKKYKIIKPVWTTVRKIIL